MVAHSVVSYGFFAKDEGSFVDQSRLNLIVWVILSHSPHMEMVGIGGGGAIAGWRLAMILVASYHGTIWVLLVISF